MDPNPNSGMPVATPSSAAPMVPDAASSSNSTAGVAAATETAAPVVTSLASAIPAVSSDHLVEQQDLTKQYRSKVNGLGMWSAWERNFSNKLKACLDLVDNAVDAALWDSDDEGDEEEENEGRSLSLEERWNKQTGSIHISTERHRLATGEASIESDNDGDGGKNNNEGNNKRKTSKGDPPPVIIHDIFGAKQNSNEEKSNDDYENQTGSGFRLIDDENTLCLHNDCVNPVKELRKILDVYNSDKTESAIGENGVGVKQAAAAMSDLSIVVTTRIDEEPLLMDYGDFETTGVPRIRKCLVSFGVLAKKMQSSDSCNIPSWTMPIEFNIDERGKSNNFSNEEISGDEEKKKRNDDNTNDNNNNVNDEDFGADDDFVGETCNPVLMRELSKVTASNRLLGKTMREYGGAATKNRRKYGIQRLAKHIELMVSSPPSHEKTPKPPHPHQYLMILHKFGKHNPHANKNGDKNTKEKIEEGILKARNELDDLLRDLADEMPKTYLHIPPAPFFKVKINRETLKFQYWERHLVELHQIPLIVDRKNDFRTAEDWLIPGNEDDTYEVKVSIGFDPLRANPRGSKGFNKNNSSDGFIGGQACSLLIFSRISGRLFMKHDDARGLLRLTNSGTHYCQGLTIIVDDYEGHLPLTPTKESLAFGMEDYGKIHERNLYAWLGALANVYWTHFQNVYKTKKSLGDVIKSKIHRIKDLERKEPVDIPTLRFGSFSTVEKLSFSRERVRDSIRPFKSEQTKWTLGPSTLVKFGEHTPKPKASPKPSDATSKKRKASSEIENSAMDGYDSDGNDLMGGPPPESAFQKNLPSPEVDPSPKVDRYIATPSRQRLDGRPVRSTIKPQRFEEIHDMRVYKKKAKPGGKEETGSGDVQLKKRLKNTEAQLREAKAELNASQATCDDLQIQLEELEQKGTINNSKILQLESELKKSGAKLESELQTVRDENTKKVASLMDRIRELEAKNT